MRNVDNPDYFVDSYASIYIDGGWGIRYFETPYYLPPLIEAPLPVVITNSRMVETESGILQYATLDNLNPFLLNEECSKTPLPLPSGWTFAPNSYETLEDIHFTKFKSLINL